MTVTETLLVFVGIPVAVMAIFFALVFGLSSGGRGRRYRPDLPYEFTSVWFIAPQAVVSDSAPVVPPQSQGGARDTW